MKKGGLVVSGVIAFALCLYGNAFGEEVSAEENVSENGNEIQPQEAKDVRANDASLNDEAENF
ncbi:MAG: hypothetical protein K6C34_05330, partial [Alphaproteobacteria bacterium]|nr:hypothetical protein [Alphaproteobacteria bacterium]